MMSRAGRIGGAARVLLLAWIGLGAVHTTVSFVRQGGLHPSTPPALGLAVASPVEDVATLRELLAGLGDAAVLLALPPAADTAEVLYLRYQLAHLLYPLRVYGTRDPGPAPLAEPAPAGAPARPIDWLVTRSGAAAPPGWAPAALRDGFTLWAPEAAP